MFKCPEQQMQCKTKIIGYWSLDSSNAGFRKIQRILILPNLTNRVNEFQVFDPYLRFTVFVQVLDKFRFLYQIPLFFMLLMHFSCF